jgi:hypothetical protein
MLSSGATLHKDSEVLADVSITGSVLIAASLTVNEASVCRQSISVIGSSMCGASMTIGGYTFVNRGLSIAPGSCDVSPSVSASDTVITRGDLCRCGYSEFDGDVSIAGSATLSSLLSVQGTACLPFPWQ